MDVQAAAVPGAAGGEAGTPIMQCQGTLFHVPGIRYSVPPDGRGALTLLQGRDRAAKCQGAEQPGVSLESAQRPKHSPSCTQR